MVCVLGTQERIGVTSAFKVSAFPNRRGALQTVLVYEGELDELACVKFAT